jgi:hypothetical protein
MAATGAGAAAVAPDVRFWSPFELRHAPLRRLAYRWAVRLDVGEGDAPGDVVTMRSRRERSVPRR